MSDIRTGTVWQHTSEGHEVWVHRITDDHVHYRIADAQKAVEQYEAVQAFMDENDISLVYAAVRGGSCCPPAEFVERFDLVTDESA